MEAERALRQQQRNQAREEWLWQQRQRSQQAKQRGAGVRQQRLQGAANLRRVYDCDGSEKWGAHPHVHNRCGERQRFQRQRDEAQTQAQVLRRQEQERKLRWQQAAATVRIQRWWRAARARKSLRLVKRYALSVQDESFQVPKHRVLPDTSPTVLEAIG